MDELIDFGQAVLRKLDTLVPLGTTQADLALELGLCALMHRCDTDVEEAMDQLWQVREAVLAAGQLDPAIEPIPFSGREAQAALLNLVIYLGNLADRAAANARCDTADLVARAEVALVSATPRVQLVHHRFRGLRTS